MLDSLIMFKLTSLYHSWLFKPFPASETQTQLKFDIATVKPPATNPSYIK